MPSLLQVALPPAHCHLPPEKWTTLGEGLQKPLNSEGPIADDCLKSSDMPWAPCARTNVLQGSVTVQSKYVTYVTLCCESARVGRVAVEKLLVKLSQERNSEKNASVQ